MVASAARHKLNLWAYPRDVLERLATGEKDLNPLPDVQAAAHPEAIRSFRAYEREAVATAKYARRQRRRAQEPAQQHHHQQRLRPLMNCGYREDSLALFCVSCLGDVP